MEKALQLSDDDLFNESRNRHSEPRFRSIKRHESVAKLALSSEGLVTKEGNHNEEALQLIDDDLPNEKPHMHTFKF